MLYDFRFFETPPASDPVNRAHWFPVHYILDRAFDEQVAILDYLMDNGLVSNDKRPSRLLSQLHRIVRDKEIISFFEETDQSIDKVLDIFIRVNSGGTILSHSDLLLSIATAQWTDRDARQDIQELVDALNNTGDRFAFTKDVVLKAGLMLTDIPDVGFKVTNFNRANMATLEENWDNIGNALHVATNLLADFGFSAATLTASSVLIPIAYYVRRRNLDSKYLTASKYDADRLQLRHWVVRTLIKSGIWGSGLDTLLRDLRKTIVEHGADSFPTAAIEATMAARGKPLSFEREELEALVETPYKDKRAFALLSLLFPAIDTRKKHHVDHIFPQSLFTKLRLRQAGVPSDHLNDWEMLFNNLPNLQLLDGQINSEKLNKSPLDWVNDKYADPVIRDHFLAEQDLSDLPASVVDFPDFYQLRKDRLTTRLMNVLGVAKSSGPTVDAGTDSTLG